MVSRGTREALALLDGVREPVRIRAAHERRHEAREEGPGGARDGGGVAACPRSASRAARVDPSGEGAVADGGGALGGVRDSADYGHESALRRADPVA